jgi:transcriptional antiterminator Rof (Rho-off)
MSRKSQEQLGRCDFIDVLEEAVLRRRPVVVQLRAGEQFTDRIVDVVTEGGDDYAVFGAHPRVAVGDIATLGPEDAPG